jgi:hypothetical protein
VVAERGMAGIVAPGAWRGRFSSEGQSGRCKKTDLSYALPCGSTVLGAVEGDRTIEAWPPNRANTFLTPVRTDADRIVLHGVLLFSQPMVR